MWNLKTYSCYDDCNVSKDYRLFSDVDNDMDGQVKLIYRTESIKAN